jgi:translation initiation factor IF-1
MPYRETAYYINRRRDEELSRDDLIQLEGVVKKMLGGGTMEVECDQGLKITGVLSGRMKKNKIKVIVGDKVQVSVSPYDTSHGLITYRLR